MSRNEDSGHYPHIVMQALRDLDDAVTAHPRRYLPHAVAAAGLLYALIGSGWWLYSIFTFTYADASDRAQAMLMCAWSALPLLLVFRGTAPRLVGLLVLVSALLQFALFRGNWGLELAYLPLVLVGLLLLLFGQGRRR